MTPAMQLKIKKTTIDVCPLCSKLLEGSEIIKVKNGKRLLFYAHKDCISTIDKFIKLVKWRV